MSRYGANTPELCPKCEGGGWVGDDITGSFCDCPVGVKDSEAQEGLDEFEPDCEICGDRGMVGGGLCPRCGDPDMQEAQEIAHNHWESLTPDERTHQAMTVEDLQILATSTPYPKIQNFAVKVLDVHGINPVDNDEPDQTVLEFEVPEELERLFFTNLQYVFNNLAT